MKKNRIISFLSAGILLLGGACSTDTLDPGAGDDDQKVIDPSEGVYLTVNFDLPAEKSTRSFTNGENSSNSGTEVGQSYENTVQSVAIVLASFTNQFIAYTLCEKTAIMPVGTTGRSYRATGKFSKTDLASNYYNQDDDMFAVETTTGNHKINVYVFCNPTESLLKLLEGKDGTADSDDDQWFNAKGTWDDNLREIPGENDVIWKKDYFLMSNASVSTRLFPPSIDDWDPYSSESSPFNLSGMNSFGRPNEVDNLTDRGNIAVERVAARYDFRDGAINKPDGADETYNGCDPQTYHVVLDAKKNPLVDVFLGRMSIVNMNRNYYYLRRVSNNGQQTPYQNNGEPNKLTICGPEMPWIYDSDGSIVERGNYIVDADWYWKYSGNNVFSDYSFAQKFNYPFFDDKGILDNVDESNGRWDTYMIDEVLKGAPDNWNNKVENGQETPNTGKYHIWRYLTEGTIPGINSQKNGVSNGIVFKGQMLPARDADDTDDYYTKLLLNALKVVADQSPEQVEKNHLIFKYGGHLYCGWEHIRRMAIQLAITDLRKEDGKWVCSINRSVGLYNAVFGTGGFGEVTFQIEGDDVKTANFMIEEGKGNATLTDVMTDVDTASANALFNSWNHSGFDDKNTAYTNFRKAVVNNKITIYQESKDEAMGGWAYYCYYFYWNRHNDNGVTGVMGPMEFAVVRNNVYKLAVTKIAQLGHPRIVVNDPDAPDPNTPDEKADVYITVTCTTLPWVVRENGIEF